MLRDRAQPHENQIKGNSRGYQHAAKTRWNFSSHSLLSGNSQFHLECSQNCSCTQAEC